MLYLRRSFPQHLLAELLGISRSRITRTITETRRLLDQHEYAIAPTTARFHAPADVIAFLTDANTAPSAKLKDRCNYLRALTPSQDTHPTTGPAACRR